MAENKTGLTVVVMLVTALVVVGLIQGLWTLVASESDTGKAANGTAPDLIRPVGQLNKGEPITLAGRPAVLASPATSTATPAATAQPDPAATSTPAPAAATTPTPAAGTPAKAAARTGEQVYKSACFACHGTGAAGAPKLGDKAAWASRVPQGMDLLTDHAIKGFTGKTGVMPARGTCGSCSDAELRSAVEYMVSKAK